MGSLKAPLLLATGVVIGLAAGFPLGRGLTDEAPRPETRDAPATAARVLELEKELAAERSLRVEPTAALTPTAPAASAVVARPDPVAPAPLAKAATRPALDPAAVKARLERVPAEIEAAWKAKDAKAAVALLRELSQLGPLAGKAALGLAVDLGRSIEDDDNPLGVNVHDYYKAVRSGDFPDLYRLALENPKDFDAGARRLAARELPWTDVEGVNAMFLRQLASEPDRTVAWTMARALTERPDQDNVDPIADALRRQTNPKIRAVLIEALAAIPGDSATRALTAYVPGETSQDVKKEAEITLQSRLATVAGYLITDVGQGSQAALVGIKPGDILTSFRGSPIHSMEDFGKAKESVRPEDQIPLTVSRDGQSLAFTIKGPRIGIDGRFVKPEAR